MIYFVSAVLLELLSASYLQGQTATHGTVNIMLANANGLVAVTDSQLSGNGPSRRFGQKLFRIDDHTICTIAGFYSSTGPSFGGEFAVKAEIPSLIQRYISGAQQFKADTPLLVKFEALENALTFSLEMVATANKLNGSNALPDSSQVTVAGYEQGKIRILQTVIKPHLVNGAYQYDPEPSRLVEVVDKLEYVTAGLDTVAQLMLVDPKSEYSQGLVALQKYFKDRTNSAGRNLSISDLEAVAVEIEAQSEKRYQGLVGGPLQVAFLTNGSVSRFKQPVLADISLNPYVIGVAENIGLSGSDGEAISTKGTVAAFVHDATISDINQRLDKLFVTGSTFRDVLFWYDGSPVVLFDTTNTVKNCALVLGSGVTTSDKFVSSLLAHYPQIKILDASKVKPIAPISLVVLEH